VIATKLLQAISRQEMRSRLKEKTDAAVNLSFSFRTADKKTRLTVTSWIIFPLELDFISFSDFCWQVISIFLEAWTFLLETLPREQRAAVYLLHNLLSRGSKRKKERKTAARIILMVCRNITGVRFLSWVLRSLPPHERNTAAVSSNLGTNKQVPCGLQRLERRRSLSAWIETSGESKGVTSC